MAVYIVRAGQNGPVKIGFAGGQAEEFALHQRFAALREGSVMLSPALMFSHLQMPVSVSVSSPEQLTPASHKGDALCVFQPKTAWVDALS